MGMVYGKLRRMKTALLICVMTMAAVAAPLQPEIVAKIRDYLPATFHAMPARVTTRRIYPLVSATLNNYDRKRSLDTAKTEFALLELSDDGKRALLAFADAKDKFKSIECWFKTEDVLDLPKTTKAEDLEFEGLCLLYHSNGSKRPYLFSRSLNPSVVKLGEFTYKKEKFLLVLTEMLRVRDIGDKCVAYALACAKIHGEAKPELYEERVQTMLAEDAYQPGVHWDNSSKPLLAKVGNGGCAAFVTDFAAYNFNKSNFNEGEPFDKASEIRGGDVLRLDGHFIAVVSRNGDKLFTFDGNCNSTFRKSKTAYSIVNGELKGGKFLRGWHYMPPPAEKSAGKKRGASAGK